MTRSHVDHGDIVRFAQDRVSLPREKANEYRAQARRLRERLESYLKEHSDFTLRKMLLSGSPGEGDGAAVAQRRRRGLLHQWSGCAPRCGGVA